MTMDPHVAESLLRLWHAIPAEDRDRFEDDCRHVRLKLEAGAKATETLASVVDQHVRDICFDGTAEADPDCILCKAASAGRVWQSLGFDDPLSEESDGG